jgi:RNA polymerase sigma-70 factor (ECF subfamily)
MTSIGELETHRMGLAAHCYRMLGSVVDADDAVQDTLLRAWRGSASFDGRSSVRTWRFRIATNVCLDALARRRKQQRMFDEGPQPAATRHWLEPVATDALEQPAAPAAADPAAVVDRHESVRLAFVAALQHLPAKQRAALLLAEVLGWSAREIADAIDATVPSVNSALQRARASVSDADLSAAADALTDAQRRRLERYVQAFRGGDATSFAGLLREDAGFRVPEGQAAWAIRFRCWRGCGGAGR